MISTWEYFRPRRVPTTSRPRRWFTNFSLFFTNAILVQALTTLTIANLAYLTWKNGWGLLNLMHLPTVPHIILSILCLDLQAYVMHVIYHKISYGWRFHRVHHSDVDLDASSGLRFHPFESLASFIAHQPFVLLVGPSPLAIYIFDLFYILFTFMTHANIRLFPLLDKILRWFLVTPDMHRVHHSTDWEESNFNYGASFSLWDHLFRTYRPQPKIRHEKMSVGLAGFQSPEQVNYPRSLLFPFLKKRN